MLSTTPFLREGTVHTPVSSPAFYYSRSNAPRNEPQVLLIGSSSKEESSSIGVYIPSGCASAGRRQGCWLADGATDGEAASTILFDNTTRRTSKRSAVLRSRDAVYSLERGLRGS